MSAPDDNEPLISIVTVGRNAADDMEKTARSIVAQGWRGFEWVVVDGGSLDDTVARLDPYRAAIACLVREPSQDRYEMMNRGLARCRGQYVLFLAAGDWFASSESLAQMARRLHLGSAPALLFGRAVLLDPEDGYREPRGAPFSWGGVAFGRLPPPRACLLRRRALQAFGGFAGKFGCAADRAAVLAVAAAGAGVDFQPVNLIVFPTNGPSARAEEPFRLLRAQAKAVRALAPRWVGVVHTLWWPVPALRVIGHALVDLLGFLAVWRRVKRALVQ